MNSPFKDIILSYIDEPEPDGSENYDANPTRVSSEGDKYTLKIVSRVREGQRTYYPEDWHYWCAMVSITDDCLISIKKDSPFPIDENGHAEIPVGTLYIKEEAFINCSNLVSVTIPDTVLEIRDLAFCGCTNLASIDIPSPVRLIGPSAFNGCTSLAKVVISSYGLLIKKRAFAGCTSLADVVFKNDPLMFIDHDAFEGCPCEEEAMRKKYHYQKSSK